MGKEKNVKSAKVQMYECVKVLPVVNRQLYLQRIYQAGGHIPYSERRTEKSACPSLSGVVNRTHFGSWWVWILGIVC
jgi:hypothetical protein